jgi:hypothetical protein
MRFLIQEGVSDMITVKRNLLSEKEALERLDLLRRRYAIQSNSYEESAAGLMSDFDAQKWLSLCDQLKVARRRRSESSAGAAIPRSLRSIYMGYLGGEASFSNEDLEDTSDKLIALAA